MDKVRMSENSFDNGLSDAQSERLAILAEECGEVIQIVGKILRHGYHSYNPTVPEMQQKPNTTLLQKELGDLLWAISKLDEACDINFQIPRTNATLNMWLRRKEESTSKYLHHQPVLNMERTADAAGQLPSEAGRE